MKTTKNQDKRAESFLKCLGNGSGSPEQAYADDTPEDEGEEEE